jgi:hypothetical protein
MSSKGAIFKFKTGSLFAAPLKLGGFLVILVGLVIAISATTATTLIASLFILIGGFFGTASTGILLDPNTKSIKHYTSVLGYKKGDFKKLDDYPFITILKKNKGSAGKQRIVFEVYMLSKTHRGKTLVHINASAKAANEAMNKIAKAFNLEITKYNEPMGVKNGHRLKSDLVN